VYAKALKTDVTVTMVIGIAGRAAPATPAASAPPMIAATESTVHVPQHTAAGVSQPFCAARACPTRALVSAPRTKSA
jgi:hypothetical protein